MGKDARKAGGVNRRDKIEALRREEKARQRKRTLLITGTAAVVGVALIVGAVFAIRAEQASSPRAQDPASFGVAAAVASCQPATTDAVAGSGDHVGPGTSQPNVTKVQYATVPPTSGQHFPVWADVNRSFYTAADRPAMENLVHNLEHGYLVIWYDDTVPADQVQALQDLATRFKADNTTRKVIVSAWDPAYGALGDGVHVAASRWGASQGHRLLCGQVSGEALANFFAAYPSTDSPEPNTP